MKRIAIGVLAAWCGIVALAWWLASERLRWCAGAYGRMAHCNVVSAMETRDNVLVWGAAIPLMLFVALIVLGIKRLRRQPGHPLTTPALHSRHPH